MQHTKKRNVGYFELFEILKIFYHSNKHGMIVGQQPYRKVEHFTSSGNNSRRHVDI